MVDTRRCGVLEVSNLPGWLMSALVFVVTCLMMTSASVSQRYFQLQPNPAQGPTRLGDPWFAKSRTWCANHCMTVFDNCSSFLFHSVTGLCTPSAHPHQSQPPAEPTEGDLFHSFYCDASRGFSVTSYGDTVACVAMFGPATYAEADVDCQSKGAYLMSVRTAEKYSLLAYNVSGNQAVWVGCDDLLQEGTFVWKEDGQEVTSTERNAVFDASDPATDNETEDCVGFHPNKSGLGDNDCALSQKYVCEMPYTYFFP